MKFSIVTPSFRNSDWLKLCIASVADQDIEHEHIIQDSCSDDGTQDWLPHDPRVKAFIEKDRGMYDAVNRGFKRASGELLAYINCDEQYLPAALSVDIVEGIADRARCGGRNDTTEAPTHGVAEEFDRAVGRMTVKDLPAMLESTRELFDLIAAAAGRSVQTASRASSPCSRWTCRASREVLEGAAGCLDRVAGLQVEVSLVPFYEGEALFEDITALLRPYGFELSSVEPGFTDERTGRLLQMDALYFRF